LKRLALLTVFFYICTFASPHRTYAVVPLALIAAAAVGTAMMSASVGTYYAKNGVLPEYVSSAASSLGSAADRIFQPSYLAYGPIALATAASFPAISTNYLAKDGYVSAAIGDIVDFIHNSTSSAYDDFKDLIDAHSSDDVYGPVTSDDLSDPTGTIWTDSLGNHYLIASGGSKWNGGSFNSPTEIATSCLNLGPKVPTGLSDGSYLRFGATSGGRPTLWKFIPTTSTLPQFNGYCFVYYWYPTVTTSTEDDVTYAPSPGAIDYPGLKDDLDPVPTGVADSLPSILKNMPSAQVDKSSSLPDTAESADAPPTISASEMSQLLKNNTAEVATLAAQAAATAAAANPDDATAQIAAAQAALEAAKAAEEAAESANEPEPEPEPTYPVPSAWYTKSCDLSNGLGSCIDYQQVINATSAFQSTALYQFPNLILQCLGYVEGDGCEYPPKISIDLFTRFSSGPINIDLSPFESVVKVMKFFFAILCLVGTGKATMTLFE
jgi:hypothetical protein